MDWTDAAKRHWETLNEVERDRLAEWAKRLSHDEAENLGEYYRVLLGPGIVLSHDEAENLGEYYRGLYRLAMKWLSE